MILFVADLFVEDYVGGGELTTEAIIKGSLLPVQKVHAQHLTTKIMEQHKDKFWIFGNYAHLSESCILYAIKNLNYVVLEYDYKYCILRSPEKHIAHDGECDCHNQRRGKIVSIFYKKSLQTWFMSEKQREKYINKFSFLGSPNIKVLNSVFSTDTLDYIQNLDTNNKNNKWLITNSPSWIKGTQIAIDYANENNLEYELVWGLAHKDLLKKMATSRGVIYLPPGGDTCPRFIMEAKMLGCKLILNDYVQHKDEEWFKTKESTVEHMQTRTKVFWSSIEDEWGLITPKFSQSDEKNRFNIIVPFYNCEPWILKCLKSIHNQKYSNFRCFIIDDMSTDNSSKIIKDFIADKNNFKLISNTDKKYALANIAYILNEEEHCPEDVNIILDGDDWFSSYNVLSYLNSVYVEKECLMTYGTYVYYPLGTMGVEPSEYPADVIENNLFRKDKWRASHLRTFKHLLWNNLDMEDLKDEQGEYYKTAYDQVLMLPLLEMSSEKSHYIDKIMHVYNRSNPLNVDKVKQALQYATAMEIRNKKPYEKIG
jgi:hypothetical protein